MDGGITGRRALVWGAVGGAMLFVSHPAALVLGACGVAVALVLARRHERVQLEQFAWGVGVVAAAFIVEYAVSLRNLSANQVLAAYWHDGYPPQPFHLGTAVDWIVNLPAHLVPAASPARASAQGRSNRRASEPWLRDHSVQH